MEAHFPSCGYHKTEYLNASASIEKKNADSFRKVTSEALDELKSARNNTDGWLYDNLPETYQKLTMNMVDEFLSMSVGILESAQGSYELGMLIGRHFDDKASIQTFA